MWYIITPFKKKCLGNKLPESVVKHADTCSLRYWENETHYDYFLKYAFVTWEKEGKDDKE